jgi:hypothetical protein
LNRNNFSLLLQPQIEKVLLFEFGSFHRLAENVNTKNVATWQKKLQVMSSCR